MRKLIVFFVSIIVIYSIANPANSDERKIPYADAVPFLGIEEVSKGLKKAVCAIQLSNRLLKFDLLGST